MSGEIYDRAGRPKPTEVRLKQQEKTLIITFEDGNSFHLPAELLRVESPSAEVQGHGPGQKRAVPHADQVRITAAEPVGRYAVRLVFDDGHDSGIYAWTLLRSLGEAAHTPPAV